MTALMTEGSRRLRHIAALLAGTCLSTTHAFAQNATWRANPGSASWNTGANWNPSTVPTGTATFGASSTTALTFSANTSIGNLKFNVGAPVYSFNLSGFNWSIGNNNLDTAISGVISDGGLSGSLTKAGTGTLSLSGINTYTGATTISAGTLRTDVTKALSTATAVTVASGATFNLFSNNQSIGSLAGDGSVRLGTATLTTGNDGTSTTFTGVIQGLAGLTKTGAGTFILTGSNIYTAATMISAGTLQLGNGGTTGSITSDVVDNGLFAIDRSNTVTFGNVISGTGGFQQLGTGTTIFNAANTYTGATTISDGTLRTGVANALSTATAVTVASGATFNLFSNDQSIGSLAGGGSVRLGTATLTTGTDGTSTTFSGVMQGIGGLTKTGAGTFTLTDNNTYTGATTISDGTLRTGVANALSTGTAVTMSSGTTFNLLGNDQSIGSLAGDGSVRLGAATLTTGNDGTSTTFNGIILGAGDLTKTGAGTFILTGSNIYTGATTISAGTLQLGNGGTTGLITTDVVDNGVFAVDRSNTFTFGHVISGAGGFQQLGTGTTIFDAENIYTGATTISAGTLQLGNGGTAGSITSDVVDNSLFAIDRSNTVTFGNVISGTGGFQQLGAGTTIFNAANTYTGATTISDGTLRTGVANALSTATAVTVGSGATFNLFGNDQSIGSLAGGGSVRLGAADLTTGNDGTSTTFSGVMQGIGGLTKTGAGTFTLTGSNSYTGATTISGGTLQTGVANALSPSTAVSVSSGATFDLAGNDQSIGSLAGTGSVQLGSATLGTGNDGTTTTFSGVIQGSGGLTKTGTGTFILTGSNSYTGATTISAGALQLGNGGTAGSITTDVVDNSIFAINRSDTFTFSNVISGTGGFQQLGTGTTILNAANTYTGATTISNGILQLGNGSTTGSIAGDVVDNGILAVDRSDAFTFGHVISGAGGFQQLGTGTTVFNAVNSYAGATTIAAGTLETDVANALSTATAVTIASGATFNLASNDQSIGSLAGAGSVHLGSATLTTGNDGTSTMFSGVVDGVGGLTKVGGGVFILSGANTYTGATAIAAGTLQAGVANALSTSTAVTVAPGATFDLASNDQSIGSLAGAGSVQLGSANLTIGNDETSTTFSGVIQGSGGLMKTGAGTFILAGSNTYTGATTIAGGTLQLGNGGDAGSITSDVVNNGIFAVNRSDTFTFGNAISGPGEFQQLGTGTTIFDATNTYTGATTILAGTLETGVANALSRATAVTVASGATFNLAGNDQSIGSLAGGGSLQLGSATLTTGNDATSTTFAGVIAGSGGLTKTGAGTFTLTGSDTYTGTTTISAGTLQLGNGGTTGSISSDVVNNSIFAVDRSDTFTFGHVISGPGQFQQVGTGTTVFDAMNSYTGATTISAGTLQTGVANALSTATAVTVASGATFDLAGNDQSIGSLAGTGSVQLGSATLTTGNDGTSTAFSGVIAGAGGLTKTAGGTFTLTGANTYAGPTNVNAGILSVDGSILSPVFVNSGGTLGGTGTVGQTVINSGGTLAPGDAVGTLTVNGNLVLKPGATYVVELAPAAGDATHVTGPATLAGTVQAQFEPGTAIAHTYTILSADGGRNGMFDTLVAPNFFTWGLSYTATNVVLANLASSQFGGIPGLSPNQKAVGSALDAAFANNSVLGGAFATVAELAPDAVPAALTALSGEGASGTQETAFATSDLFLSAMMDQTAYWRNGDAIDNRGITLAYAPLQYGPSDQLRTHPAFQAMPPRSTDGDAPHWRTWLAGFDATWSLSGEPSTGSASLNHRTGGMAAGLNYQFTPDLMLGLAAGGSRSTFSVPDRTTSGVLDAAHFGAYGTARWGPLYAAGTLAFASLSNNINRTILGVGPAETASGNFGSDLLSGRLEVGWKRVFDQFAVTPFAAAQFAELWQAGYTETSTAPAGTAGVLGLTYGSHTASSLPTFLGAQIDSRFAFANGMLWSPYGRASWMHEFDPTRDITASLITVPGASFTVDGPSAARNAVRLSLGSKLDMSRSAALFASLDSEFSNRSQNYAGKGGLQISW